MKRIFDLICATMGIAVLSLLLIWIAWRIKSEDGGPVFYRGERMGLHGKPFSIYKFRTMVVDAERLGAASTSDDDLRITRIGRFLRKYKLDELPQLINVLIGDMSLVGPRPEVKKFTDMYTKERWPFYRFGRESPTGPPSGIRMKRLFWQGRRIRIRHIWN